MYILARKELGEAPQPAPWRYRLDLRSQPLSLRFMNLDQFKLNKASLTPRLLQMVKQLAKHVQVSWKTMQPIGIIRLIGHTDNTGTHELNVKLGNRRAEIVKAALEQLLKEDILKRRIAILVEESPGELKWIANNRTPKGQALNRRVEVFVAPPDSPPPKLPPPPPPPPPPVIQTTPGPFPWWKLPTPAQGKSLEDWLNERLTRLPQGRRIRDAILRGGCYLLEELFRREGGTLGEKQKEDFRKRCRDAAKRRI